MPLVERMQSQLRRLGMSILKTRTHAQPFASQANVLKRGDPPMRAGTASTSLRTVTLNSYQAKQLSTFDFSTSGQRLTTSNLSTLRENAARLMDCFFTNKPEQVVESK
jgi:hypothetical protein